MTPFSCTFIKIALISTITKSASRRVFLLSSSLRMETEAVTFAAREQKHKEASTEIFSNFFEARATWRKSCLRWTLAPLSAAWRRGWVSDEKGEDRVIASVATPEKEWRGREKNRDLRLHKSGSGASLKPRTRGGHSAFTRLYSAISLVSTLRLNRLSPDSA